MAESAVATLAGRSARLDGVLVAAVVSADALRDGPQPEKAANAAAVSAIESRMAGGVLVVASATDQCDQHAARDVSALAGQRTQLISEHVRLLFQAFEDLSPLPTAL